MAKETFCISASLSLKCKSHQITIMSFVHKPSYLNQRVSVNCIHNVLCDEIKVLIIPGHILLYIAVKNRGEM